jgi:CheY-like chemotaxis protein
MMNTPKERLTILVVDDEFIFRELNKKRIDDFLKNKIDYDILTASGIKKALEIAENKSIDLVFTDLCMDDREDSGLFLADKLKSLNSSTEVFIVSNANLEHIEDKALGSNASGCFQLPLQKGDLESAFGNFITTSHPQKRILVQDSGGGEI